MDSLKCIVDGLLNPKSRLERLRRSTADERENANGGSSNPAGARGRLGWRDVVFNLPLMIGLITVVGLFLLVLFGPVWAPKNPYISGQHIVPHYDFKAQEFISPPLAPSPEFPLGTDRWGNDLLSLLMHGARNTLVACAFITMVRLVLGLVMGGLAGWNEGKISDQFVMGLIGVINSVPMLISSMILIYALDIRRGLPVFIVAMSVIGWTEIAQYIRSEFLVLRKQPYIEGARSVGLNDLQIAVRHVLPNVLPQLLIISFLEMGAVLMLLGELGFVGVYIGGGSQFIWEKDLFSFEIFTIVEVPEWGAMLAEGFRWLRPKPFVVFPPALAFFVAVVGFNTLGEGLRRLVEKSAISTAFLLKKRMILVVAALTLATVFIVNNTGADPWFSRVAGAFDGRTAYDHVETLAQMEGRGAGQVGGAEAAAYIAEQFEAYGLQPGWLHNSYYYPLKTWLVRPTAQPYLGLIGPDGEPVQAFRHQLDFGFVIDGHGGSGDVEAPLTFVGFKRGESDYDWETFKGLDLRGRIVLLMTGNAPDNFADEALIRGALGVLWIEGEGRDAVRSQFQVIGADQDPPPGRSAHSMRAPTMPIFRIRPSVARAMLEPDGMVLTADGQSILLDQGASVGHSGPGWFTVDMSAIVRMSLDLSAPQDIEIPCVMGFQPGSDFDLAAELVVLFASYDGLGTDPDGTVFPAVNHNASGVGMLLEIARVWQEQDLDVRRSVLFVAWGGSQLDDPGAETLFADSGRFSFLLPLSQNPRFDPLLVFQPDDIGAGGESLFIHPGSHRQLSGLVEKTAQELGIPVVYDLDDEGSAVAEVKAPVSGIGTPWVYFAWADAQVAPDEDQLQRVEAEKLQKMGEAFALALTRIVREAEY
jgi:ABC-type dipeptide/oligopeptide/nickel transport system permease subunit